MSAIVYLPLPATNTTTLHTQTDKQTKRTWAHIYGIQLNSSKSFVNLFKNKSNEIERIISNKIENVFGFFFIFSLSFAHSRAHLHKLGIWYGMDGIDKK